MRPQSSFLSPEDICGLCPTENYSSVASSLSCRRTHFVFLQATLTGGLAQPDARGPCGAPMQQAPGPLAVSLSPPPSACHRERGTLTQLLQLS